MTSGFALFTPSTLHTTSVICMSASAWELSTAASTVFTDVRVPANMTNLFQPLDLTVNGSAKAFMKRKFTEWYGSQISKALDDGVVLDDIDIKLRLSVLKPLHASWLVELFNHMTSNNGRQIIANGWKSAGITEALSKGSGGLESLDPFASIDPLDSSPIESVFIQAPHTVIANDQLGDFINIQNDDDSDDEWEVEDSADVRNIFDVLDDEM